MSNAPTVEAAPTKGRALQLGEAILQGRLQSVRKAGTAGFSHLLVLPAPDAYSSPATVEIMATNRLGASEDDIRVRVRIGGYRRTYKATDKDTGEVRNVTTADNRLFAVEE